MVRVRHFLFKEDRIKQLLLIPLQPTHHGPFPPLTASTSENHCSRKPSTDFCNKIGAKRTLRRLQRPLGENGCDTIQPFRAISPPNLRLKSGGLVGYEAQH